MYATIWAIVGLPPLGVSSRYRGVGRTFERPRHTAGDFKWGRGLVMSGKGCDGGRKEDARKSVPVGFYERWARATAAVARGGAGDTP